MKRLLRRLQFKQRLLIGSCGHCRAGATALAGCGSHLICRRCGDFSPHCFMRGERAAWRARHVCPRLFAPRTSHDLTGEDAR